MKKIILFIVIINLISCTKGDMETTTDLIIENNSGHSLEYTVYSNNGTIIDSQAIENNNQKKYKYTDKGDMGLNFFPFKSADSVVVIFDGTYSITHYKHNNIQNGSQRTILDLNNWNKLKDDNRYFKYRYIFTENEFNEAN